MRKVDDLLEHHLNRLIRKSAATISYMFFKPLSLLLLFDSLALNLIAKINKIRPAKNNSLSWKFKNLEIITPKQRPDDPNNKLETDILKFLFAIPTI